MITAGSPATVREKRRTTGIYPDGQPRLSSLIADESVAPGPGRGYYGHVVTGTGLYTSFYIVTEDGEVDPSQAHNDRKGGGWGDTTNTRGGALYTIRLPLTSPLKPVVKKVRSSDWQGFDALIAETCGQYGTLLLGIDKETQSGYLYAVGHANGTATVIQGLGKVPATFADSVNFRHVTEPRTAPLLFGE